MCELFFEHLIRDSCPYYHNKFPNNGGLPNTLWQQPTKWWPYHATILEQQ